MKTSIFGGREQRESRATSGGSVTAGQRIGKYEVVREIGALPHARVRVFRAYDQDLARPVTVKLVADANDRRLADRFRLEVASVAKLRLAYVAAIYELGEQAGLPFAALQHLGEDDLESAIQTNKAITLLQKMIYMEQVAAGLAEAHRAGLAYVGLRPSGIALGADGVAGIQDFGVVRLTSGKPAENRLYGAPEEANAGFAPDRLCDVFAFGVICYEFLTGTHPFREGESADCNWRREPAALRQLLPACPETLERLVARCLEMRCELRHPNFDEIRDELRPIVQGLRRGRAAELWAEGRRLIQTEKLEEAQGVIREALQLDPDDANGQQISNDLRALLQRQKTRGKIEGLWRQADEAAAHRRFLEAVNILQSAAALDEGDAEAQSRLETMRTRLSHSVDAARQSGEARILMDQGELDLARQKVLTALDCDAEDPEAIELLRSIDEGVERREREARVEDGIARAKSLVLERSFGAALVILNGLLAENCDSARIQQWIGQVEEQKSAAERQERLQALTSQAESLVSQQRFGEAVAVIEPAAAEFPSDRGLADLLGRARDGVERIKVVDQTTARSNQLCEEHRYDEAGEAVDQVLAAMPGEPALLALRQKIEAQAQDYQRAAIVREALEQVEWLMDQDRPDLAIRFLKEQHGGMTEEADLAARLRDLEAGLPDWEMRRFLDVVEEFSARRSPRGEQDSACVLLAVLEEGLHAAAPGESAAEAARSLGSALREHAIVGEVRQYLAAGNTGQAEQIFQAGVKFLPGEGAVASLQAEIEAAKKYAGELQTAEVLVGRRRLGEARQLLLQLAQPDRPEIEDLLELVRELQAARDERVFYERVKETAQMLAGQGRPDEADRLFRRLEGLFPGDAMLETDSAGAQAGSGTDGQKDPARSVEARAPVKERPAEPLWPNPHERYGRRRSAVPRVAMMAGVLLLTASGAAVWKSLRAPASTAAASAVQFNPAGHRPAEAAPESAAAEARSMTEALAPQEVRLSGRMVVSTSTARVASPAPFRLASAEQPSLPLHQGVVEPARLITVPVSQFALLAAGNDVPGEVGVDAVVDRQGHVTEVTAMRGNPPLTAIASQAVRQWRYQPATIDGEPVEANVKITLRFNGAQQ